MRKFLSMILASVLLIASCNGNEPAPDLPRLIIQPDDGRAPLIAAIAGATNNIRLTIYEITDLQSVYQVPAAPVASIGQALIDKAQSGVNVRVIVDQNQYNSSSSAPQIQLAVQALRDAGVVVHQSSNAFCFTHQKTFVIDGPTTTNSSLTGTAIIMSLNLMPGYFGGTRDYAVITGDTGVVKEISTVFDSDFIQVSDPLNPCKYAHTPIKTKPPPFPTNTPAVNESSLLWSPVNSKPKLLQLIGGAKQSLVITTEEMTDADMVCQIKDVAQSAAKPLIRILLSGDDGSNAAAVKTLLDLGLPNLSIRIMPGQSTAAYPVPVPTPLYMHGKQVITDGIAAYVGSENMTNTSLIQNRELGTIFTDPVMIARLQSVFTTDFTTSGNSLPAADKCTGVPGCYVITCPPVP